MAVVGGGNTAMDAARIVKRKNAKDVTVIYRRGRDEMPAENEEIEAAKEEGINFLLQTNIIKILGEKNVEKLECIKTELINVAGERPRPINIEGSNYLLDIDYVIMALGAKPDKKILENLGIKVNEKGFIEINENKETSIKNVFASGDLVGEKSTVAWAARSGRNAAEEIYKKILN